MSQAKDQLELDFHRAMLDLYEQGKQLKPRYNARYLRKMLDSLRGKATADKLLASTDPASGFTELCSREDKPFRLSVEYLVLTAPWNQLFSKEQLAIAEKRLRDLGFPLPSR